jgi:hypothetical protein
MAEVVELLFSKSLALTSNTSTNEKPQNLKLEIHVF